MKALLVAALVTSALSSMAFANTNAGSKLYIANTAVGDDDLVRADYEALTWIEIKSMGNMGETGSKTNILNYDTWDTKVTQKSKGITDAGSPTIEVARIATNPGQIALRAATKTNLNYAFRIVRNDPAVIGGTPTTIYHRGLVTGPTRPNGKNEDFDLEIFTLGLQQEELIVDPSSGGIPPKNTVLPAITGTATEDEVLNLSNGTFTGDVVITYAYQWFAGGVLIPGANAATYTLTVNEVGKIMQARVTATNAAGTAQAYSNATAAVAAA